MAWTPIAKPGAQTYTNINPQGKEQYDQVSLAYDDASTYYDGINPSQWSNIAKPTATGQTWNELSGDWDANTQTWASAGVSPWTNVTKPT